MQRDIAYACDCRLCLSRCHRRKIWQDVLLAATFTAVKTPSVCIVITGTPLETSAIWEVEFYRPVNTIKE